jgi:predicted HicB family RNase H-like nuclease
MKYKGYKGEVTYDSDAKIFHGEVLGLKDVITFQGSTVNEIEKAFRESIQVVKLLRHEQEKNGIKILNIEKFLVELIL